MATTKVAMARRLPMIIPTIVPIPDALFQNASLVSLLPCPEPLVAAVEALVVVDPWFVDVEGGTLVGVLPEDTPLSFPSDEVPCREDEVLEKKNISTSRSRDEKNTTREHQIYIPERRKANRKEVQLWRGQSHWNSHWSKIQ
jgi:hypothetical protein